MQWTNYKMKVNFATQSPSHSISAAIKFLQNLKIQEFKDSKTTSDFMLLISDMLDTLNFKSKFRKNNKSQYQNKTFLILRVSLSVVMICRNH